MIQNFRIQKKLNSCFLCQFTISIIVLSLFASCKKGAYLINTENIEMNKSDTTGYMLTPEGPRLKSHVHLIENGYHLSFKNNHAYKVQTESGIIMEDFGEIQTGSINNKFLNNNLVDNNVTPNNFKGPAAPSGNGWVTYSEWFNNGSEPINYFSTNWIVPPAPVTQSTQLFYIFEGLQSLQHGAYPDDVIQPVLQWGYNGVFGGTFWTITNWYAWGTQDAAYMPPQTKISPGTNLQGIIYFEGKQPDSSFNYQSSFTGYPNATMNITQGDFYSSIYGGTIAIPQLPGENWAYEALEVPSNSRAVNYPSEYPGQLSVNMTNISLQTGPPGLYTPANLNWAKVTAPGSIQTLGEHTEIASDNSTGQGQVDLFFQACGSPIPQQITGVNWNENSLTLSWNVSTGATGYQMVMVSGPDGGGTFYNTTSTSIANFFSTIGASNIQGMYAVKLIPLGSCGNGVFTQYTINNCTNTLSPVSSASWNNSTLTLTWNPVTGATGYQIQIDSGPDGGGHVYSTTSTSIANFFNTLEIPANPGTYYINIIPQYACGNGPNFYYSFTH